MQSESNVVAQPEDAGGLVVASSAGSTQAVALAPSQSKVLFCGAKIHLPSDALVVQATVLASLEEEAGTEVSVEHLETEAPREDAYLQAFRLIDRFDDRSRSAEPIVSF